MHRTSLLLLLSAITISVSVSAYSPALDSLLHTYDQEITHADQYLQQRQQRIDLLSSIATVEAWEQIAELYRPYQCDSSIAYYTKVLHTTEPHATSARIHLIYQLAAIGFYSEAFALQQNINLAQVQADPQLTIDYYEAMNRLYSESAVYGKVEEIRSINWHKGNIYRDSLVAALQLYRPQSEQLYKLNTIHARNTKHYDKALLFADSALSMVDEYSHEYAILAYELATTYKAMDNQEMYLQWLVRSAIADVRQGITDNGSSWTLAQIVYADGELEHAYDYIQYSLTNAGIYNARLRYMQINPLGHIINQAYQQKQQQQQIRILWLVVLLAVFLGLLVLLFIYTVHQYRRKQKLNDQLYQAYDQQAVLNAELNTANAQLSTANTQLSSINAHLQEANLVKEQYICRYLEVYSAYIQRITQLARKAGEKNPEQIQSREMAEFYRSFDQTFLSIYGTFVADFNALLRPEEQIIPKQGELLTTELRIYALIRLGINSSAKIAELLCYSPNTIYNYRARVKNAAICDRDNFDNQVRLLCTI